MSEKHIVRCKYSKEGITEINPKDPYITGTVVGRTRDGGYRVLWDGYKTPQSFHPLYIRILEALRR